MNQGTLRGRLTRASLLTTLAALVLNAVLILAYEFDSYRDERVQDLHTQAVILGQSITPALVFNDPVAATQQLASLKQKQEIRVAEVFKANGRSFARYVADAADDRVAPIADPRHAPGSRYVGDLLELSYAVEHDGERVGTIYLRARHDVWRRISTYALIQAGVMALSLGLALLVFGRFQKAITEPVSRIAQVAQEVVERRDWRLRAPSADSRDIAVLADAFNRMLSEMETSTGELSREMAVRLRAEDDLRAADRKKDEFLATLAHEIRNPLAPMMNAISLLRRSDAPDALREKSVAILDRQMRQITRLIDDLLDVSRITTGKLSLKTENVELLAVLRAALELIEPVARDRQLHVEARLGPQACVVVGDAARLLQVFSNLLTNACRYTPSGGHITVTLERGDESFDVSVVDTGVGIAPAMQSRIFELFEQGDKSLERGNTGLGIGLTLARQLVQLHGGTIGVTSKGVGHGSRFTVSLPAAAAAAIRIAPPPAPARTALPGRLRILVADDNVDFAASLQALLQGAGLDVVSVSDGRAALAAARVHLPDAMILDIGMPGLNGYEVARQLRDDEATAGTTLIAVSGWGQASDRQDAAAAGFDRHFLKPVPLEDLLDALAALQPRFRRPGHAMGTPS